jgi:hypothetical protein
MAELVTEARVEIFIYSECVDHLGDWVSASLELAVPAAVEQGRHLRHNYVRIQHEKQPVRVVDSAGVVVAQWGRP